MYKTIFRSWNRKPFKILCIDIFLGQFSVHLSKRFGNPARRRTPEFEKSRLLKMSHDISISVVSVLFCCAKRRTKQFLDWLKVIQWQRQTAHKQQCFNVKMSLGFFAVTHSWENISDERERRCLKRVSLCFTLRRSSSINPTFQIKGSISI